jgi:drug/metabolite transporter (DMT)-like permease
MTLTDETAPAPPPASQRLRGIAYMIAAVFVFSLMDAMMKGMSGRYGALQIACMRSLASLVCMLPTLLWRGSLRELRATAPAWHLFRGVLGVTMLTSFIFTVHRLTLAQTYSLFLATPLMMTALSVPVFKERVTAPRWLAILVGFGGVIIILQPWNKGAYSLLASSTALLAALCYSVSALTVRSLSKCGNSNIGMVFWYLLLVGVGSGVLAASEWQALQMRDWGWLAGIGITGTLGQLWLTEAFSRAPASVVGPFEYTSIIWAFVIDRIIWSATPSLHLLIGALVVVGSGIYVVLEEHRLAAATPP